jgi:hypothetical protein
MKSEAYTPGTAPSGSTQLKLVLAWALVGIPLVWGVWETLMNALKLFE